MLHLPKQVPQGHCWVCGDNLPASRDSRIYGPLPMALIRGKVVAVWEQWSEWPHGLRDDGLQHPQA
jgi:inner membrane protease subunit 1